jgi:hypothetical protein
MTGAVDMSPPEWFSGRERMVWETMSHRERMVCWLLQVMSKIGPRDFNDEELTALVAIMRPACDRETAHPANVIHLTPRAVRNRKPAARV